MTTLLDLIQEWASLTEAKKLAGGVLPEPGEANGTFRYRVGVQFSGLGQKEEKILDDYVVDSLEMKLLSLSRDALDRSFIERENLTM